MGSTQQFCLKWNNHQSNMLSIFDQLLTSEHFVDVTLACDGLSVRAHKMVLSACSPFFQSLFIQNPCEHPIVILKDIRFVDLKALVQFMYRGEVNVSQDQLPTLLKAAETLKIKGLAEVTNDAGQKSTVGGSLGVSHNGHHSTSGGVTKTEQPSVQAAPSPLSSTPTAIPSAATHGALVAAMQQNALKAQLAAAAQVAQAAAAAAAVQNAHENRQSVVSVASHESNSNASTPLRQTDSPMSQQMRKRRRKSAGSDKGSGDENSGPESGAEDNLEETRGSDDESAGEEAEFEPSKLLEQSMTEVRQGHQDNNSSSSDNHTKDSNQADMKPVINFDTATGGNALALNPTDPSAVLAFAAAAQAAGAAAASANSGDSVAGPSQPTHGSNGMVSSASTVACSTPSPSQSSLALSLVVTPPPSNMVGTPQALGIPAGNNALQLRPSEACIPCEICGRRFRSVADVRSHVAAIHLKNSEDPERRFQCEFCPFRAYTKTSIRQHMFLHTGEVPYKCDMCSYGARQKFHLDRHRQKAHGMVPTPKRGRFPGRPSSELSILPVGPSASPPDNGSGGHNGHSSDPEMPVFPPVFPSMLDPIRLDPTALNLASNLFKLISSNGGSSSAGGNGSSASTGSDHSSQNNDL